MVKALDLRSNGSIPAWVRTPPVVVILKMFSGNFLLSTEGKKIFQLDPDGDRTRNLLIRSQTPYPLGHKATSTIDEYKITQLVFNQLRGILDLHFIAIRVNDINCPQIDRL